MSIVSGPDQNDPFGQEKETLGGEMIDLLLQRLTVSDCIQLALNKMADIPDQNREQKLVITKLEEAQLWSYQVRHTLRKVKVTS